MKLDHYSHFLSHLPVFKGLRAEDIAEIVRGLKIHKRNAGDVLCREGDPADAVYLIETGQIRISKVTAQGDDHILAEQEGPTVVGEMSLLDDAPRSATVTCTSPTTTYDLDLTTFNTLRANRSVAAYKVIRNLATILCERLRDTNAKLDAFFANPEASLTQMKKRQHNLWEQRLKNRDDTP